MRRRDLIRLAPGLGLLGCDSKKPKEGMLGRMERLNKRVESFLLYGFVYAFIAITAAVMKWAADDVLVMLAAIVVAVPSLVLLHRTFARRNA